MIAKQEHDLTGAIWQSAHVLTGRMTDLLVREEEHRAEAGERKQVVIGVLPILPPWHVDIVALTGHDLDSPGQEEVSQLLTAGWHLLHIYTLEYENDGGWQMAIMGRLRNDDEALKEPQVPMSFSNKEPRGLEAMERGSRI